ncbi:MAG TPA: hypothetical protein VGL69_15095 [Solirubrobacteraceae bacterium]|jgi:hypothetical protein
MKRFGFPATFALFALFCGPLVGSAAASTGPFAPTVDNPFPPFIGTTLTASLNPSGPLGDQLTWGSCATPIGELLPPTGSTYQLQASDNGNDVCALELDLTNAVDGISDPVGAVGPAPSLNAGAVTQGQPVGVVQGSWGTGASTPADAWFRCDAAGAKCVPIDDASGAQVTGPTYAATRADVGSTIEAWETATPANGSPSVTVPTPATGLVSAVPPASGAPQTVSGTPQIGDTLTASPVGWSNEPTSYVYQWDRCSGGSCTPIDGATDSTYVPGTADLGDTLVVFVTGAIYPGASYGSVGSPALSYPTNPVVGVSSSGAPSPNPGIATVVPVTNPHVSAVGRLTATMRWTFRYAPSYTQVAALSVQGPALGATIATRCSGKGCPFIARRVKVRTLKRCRARSRGHCRAPRKVSLERQFRGHNLAVGSRVTVTISRAHDIGKYYRFVVRRRRAPSVSISCVAPGSNVPGRNCTGL